MTGVLLATALPALAHHGEAPPRPSALTYLVAFLFGLLGQANCFGMCGPLVALHSTRFGGWPPVTAPALTHPHLAFNAGRIVCYSALGLLVGTLKVLLTIRLPLVGVVGLVAGIFVIASGLHLLGRPVPGGRVLANLYRTLTQMVLSYRRLARSPGLFALGLVHGFLPCSLLLTMLPLAAMIGSPVESALFMAAFGIGTVPVMGGLGLALNRLRGLTGRRVLAASGIVIIVWGVFLIVHGLDALGLLGFRHDFPRVSFYRLQEFFGGAGR